MSIRYIDLFSGIGGFRAACDVLNKDGFSLRSVASAEIDEKCRNLYHAAFEHAPDEVNLHDVGEITRALSDRRRDKRRILPKFDLLLAGFPCQSFSNVGQRRGMDDPRGRLFIDIAKILTEYQPRHFVLENVQKISTIGRGALLDTIKKTLTDCGYALQVWDLSAHKYGLPQQRRRMFFCGVRSEATNRQLDISPPPEVPADKWKYPTAWHLLERAMPKQHLVPALTRQTVLRKNPKWAGDLRVNRPIARPITATMHKWHRANQDNYYTEAYVTSKNPKAAELLAPEDVGDQPLRRITPLEGFRLQGFPDRFARLANEKGLSQGTQYRVIGNAVPVNMAAAVIRHFLGKS